MLSNSLLTDELTNEEYNEIIRKSYYRLGWEEGYAESLQGYIDELGVCWVATKLKEKDVSRRIIIETTGLTVEEINAL